MDSLFFLQKQRAAAANPEAYQTQITVRLITNFTDAILARLLGGVLAHSGIAATVTPTPYKQYHLDLVNQQSDLWKPTDYSVIWFDSSRYRQSEFTRDSHWAELQKTISEYAKVQSGPIFVVNFVPEFFGAHGNSYQNDELSRQVQRYNEDWKVLALKHKNIHIIDSLRLAWQSGGESVRDRRGQYAFDVPFTAPFLVAVAKEISAHIQLTMGRVRKCLVLDLDNTLWGGVVGEVGVEGIVLGVDYPGLAFKEFQRALLAYTERGLLLAINSRNNREDVDRVWQTHPHMVLRPEHFSAIQINWNNKAENLQAIAKELNIGTDSLVFFDDDAANRALVQTVLPEVLVPEFSAPPEDYIHILHGLPELNYLQLTAEDLKKAQLYREEQARLSIKQTVSNFDEYLQQLGIIVKINKNDEASLARIAQLTAKTNQCNMTTRRYSETDVARFMKEGLVWGAQVTDSFGDYGLTVVAIVLPETEEWWRLDSFLMSCRVMGRSVEVAYLDYLAKYLYDTGVKTLVAEFLPTAKNAPAKGFFADFGFTPNDQDGHWFTLDLEQYVQLYPGPRVPAITLV